MVRNHMINWLQYQFSSVQFSRSVVSDSLQPHELQHARPPCPSPAPGVQDGTFIHLFGILFFLFAFEVELMYNMFISSIQHDDLIFTYIVK